MVAARCYVSPVRWAKTKKDDKTLFWSMMRTYKSFYGLDMD